MNACALENNTYRAIGFRAAQQHSRDIFQNRHRLASVSSARFPLQEIVMPLSGKWHRSSHFAVALASTATILLSAHAALAARGPGGGPGTASGFTQLVMAILVYGSSALLVGGGLIGAMRRRPENTLEPDRP
jgi:hypothetical protein